MSLIWQRHERVKFDRSPNSKPRKYGDIVSVTISRYFAISCCAGLLTWSSAALGKDRCNDLLEKAHRLDAAADSIDASTQEISGFQQQAWTDSQYANMVEGAKAIKGTADAVCGGLEMGGAANPVCASISLADLGITTAVAINASGSGASGYDQANAACKVGTKAAGVGGLCRGLRAVQAANEGDAIDFAAHGAAGVVETGAQAAQIGGTITKSAAGKNVGAVKMAMGAKATTSAVKNVIENLADVKRMDQIHGSLMAAGKKKAAELRALAKELRSKDCDATSSELEGELGLGRLAESLNSFKAPDTAELSTAFFSGRADLQNRANQSIASYNAQAKALEAEGMRAAQQSIQHSMALMTSGQTSSLANVGGAGTSENCSVMAKQIQEDRKAVAANERAMRDPNLSTPSDWRQGAEYVRLGAQSNVDWYNKNCTGN